MSQANSLLKQAKQLARSGDMEASKKLAPMLASEVRQGVEKAPAQKGEASLSTLLEAWESGSYTAWTTSLESGNEAGARQSLVAMRAQCASCHAAIERPMIHVVGVR
ncbi:MAG: hypothetical protein KDN19_09480 [Verrucomicrobiae bacterium]|nr:hypothetical protein [Verrucomicrobiae bacterium]